MASTADKITDTRNAARPNSARVTSGRSAGGTTLACDNLSGWPTASKVHFVTYKIDSNSAVVAGSQLDCYGIASGNNIGSFTVVDGTDTGHAVGDVVEMLPTAAWGQDLADALSVGHGRTGSHVANLPLTTPVLTAPTVTGGLTTDTLTVTSGSTLPAGDIITADIATDAVTDAKMVYGKIRSRQGGSATNWNTAGTNTYDYSATNTFMQCGTIASNASPTTVTFPTAFNQVPIVVAVPVTAVGANCYVSLVNPTATNFTVQVVTDAGAANTAQTVSWIAIGE